MEGKDTQNKNKGPLWALLQKVEGDKVIMIIVLLLLLISFLAIFSSTPLLPAQESRLKTMTSHGLVAIFGICLMTGLYHMKVDWLKSLSKIGFIGSFGMLAMLLMKVNIPGILQTQTINGAVRNFSLAGIQIHVFEIVKVAMIMYLAWAMDAVKGSGQNFRVINFLRRLFPRLKVLKRPLGKRLVYVYIPTILISLMVFFGSGSSAIFICAVLIGAMLVGGVPMKELLLAGVVLFIGFFSMVTLYKVSDGRMIKRVGTMISRMNADYDINRLEGLKVGSDEYHNMVDTLSQPVSAMIAVHEGGWIGKGTGNSTQKYRVQNIYGDYMFSFLIEEYGLVGGIVILILYMSLLARSSIIARLCSDEFAKYLLGGLALLITGQAFMHIMVNVGIGPMTGQTLPLISHGASAFIAFCFAFGVILSISRTAKKKMDTAEEMTRKDMNSVDDNIEKAAKSNKE